MLQLHEVLPSQVAPAVFRHSSPEQHRLLGEHAWPMPGHVPTLQVRVPGSQLRSQHSAEVVQAAPTALHTVPASTDSQVPDAEQEPLQQSALVVHAAPVVTHADAQTKPPSVGEQIRLQQSSGDAQPAPLPRHAAPPQATPPSHTPAQRGMPAEDSWQ